MRKIIIGIMLSFACVMNSQGISMLTDDSLWEYSSVVRFNEYPDGNYKINSYFNYALGDTEEINGKIYYKLYYSSLDLDYRSVEPGLGYRYMVGLREDDGRILVNRDAYISFLQNSQLGDPDYIPYNLTDDGELILYDFNMQVGDKYNSVAGYNDVSVVEITKVETKDGMSRKLFTLSNGLKLIEGIGCINSRGMLINYLNPPYFREDLPWRNVAFLSGFGLSGEWVYKQTIDDFANNNVGIEGVKMDEADDASAPLYDLLGRKVTGVPERGIYIRDKKKIWIDKNY